MTAGAAAVIVKDELRGCLLFHVEKALVNGAVVMNKADVKPLSGSCECSGGGAQ